MKSDLLKGALAAGCLSAAILGAGAGPLQRANVIRDPVWLLHVDCDALRQTVVGQYLLGEMEKPDAQKKFAAFQAIFNFDPRKQLHGLTLYGASALPADGVLLVQADFDSARLTTLAEGANGHESSTHGSSVIHSWIDDKKPAKDGVRPRVYAAIHGQIVVFGQKESRVAEALEVLDGTAPNLTAGSQFPALATLGSGSFIVGAARKIELPQSNPNAAVLRQSRTAMLSVGETGNQLQATLALEANGEEVATQIESIGRGIVGLMKLQTDKPESVKLAEHLTVQRDGANITARLSMAAGDAVEMMKAAAAGKARH